MADADVTVHDVRTFGQPGLLWFRAIYGVLFIVFGIGTLTVFYRARKVFEIRARSAYLVTLLGLALLAYQALLVELNVVVICEIPSSYNLYFWNHIVLHFLTFTITACYMSRVVRLGVIFDSSLRRAVPWLVSEKVLVIVSLSVGMLSLALPIYYRVTITGFMAELEYEEESSDNFWACIVALQVVKCVMLPGVWMIDDIFNISRELIVIIALGIFQCVFSRLSEERMLGDSVEAVINPPNIGLLASSILFGISVVDPVRRLIYHPLSGYGHASDLRKPDDEAEVKLPVKPRITKPPKTERQRTRELTDESDVIQESSSSPGSTTTPWNYERIARIPEVAEAFREFAHRALCEESVEFLEEVARYKERNFDYSAPRGGGRLEAFKTITRRFILDGAPEEINISYKEKRTIQGLLNPNAESSLSREEELRTAFDQAYIDVRHMLECNILYKFMQTDEFLAAAHRPAAAQPRRCACCFV